MCKTYTSHNFKKINGTDSRANADIATATEVKRLRDKNSVVVHGVVGVGVVVVVGVVGSVRCVVVAVVEEGVDVVVVNAVVVSHLSILAFAR